jgi:hypothetical protein
MNAALPWTIAALPSRKRMSSVMNEVNVWRFFASKLAKILRTVSGVESWLTEPS